ncbi:hypothetical protein [Nocardiopsis sp. NPDC057823]|uniref:hypothetical protein n=1 Tax=Nocardiopsis sp. NPDC057823 TaxID=3346256 RepID=UPI00367358A3
MTENARPPGTLLRLPPVLGLLLLAPVCAEYLYGYDDSTGDPRELLGGLFLFAPLYGGAAVLIREVVRRTGRGWPAVLLLGAAFGVVQAGLVDLSLFNPSYRGIPYWEDMFSSSLLPAPGVNPNLALVFTAGHAVWSVTVPIAVVESLAPRTAARPWLGWFGLAVVAAGFAAAAVLVLRWSVETEGFVPSAGQAVGAAAAALALGAAAFLWRGPARPDPRPAPPPWAVGGTVLAALGLPGAVAHLLRAVGLGEGPWRIADSSWFLIGWPGFAVNLAVLGGLAVLLARWSARAGWGPRHVLAAAGGALLANVFTAFLARPIGDVAAAAKYTHNTVALLGSLAVLALGFRRLRKARPPTPGS